jgi:hypothetical protein
MDKKFLQYIATIDPVILWPSIVDIVFVIIVSGVILYRLKHPSDDKKIDTLIRELGTEHLRDVIISDGVYGFHFIDYLILFPDQIMLLGVQHYEGYIFGAENIDEWAQVVNKKSYKFPNPLQDYITCAQTINSLIKDANVAARMVFTSSSEFPKGVPNGVYRMEDFKTALADLTRDKVQDANIKAIWGELVNLAKEHKAQYQLEKVQPTA